VVKEMTEEVRGNVTHDEFHSMFRITCRPLQSSWSLVKSV